MTVMPGTWHSYWTAYEDLDDGDVDDADAEEPIVRELLLVHASQLPVHADPATTRAWHPVGEVPRVTRGGNIQLIDRSALGDEALIDQVRYLGGTWAYGGLALCVVAARWTGSREILVSPDAGLPTAIKIALGDPRDT